jgi:hypothetical protein
MDDAPQGFGMARLEDPMGIESTLWNASLDGCKDSLPTLRSSDDDEDDEGHEY